MAQGTTQASLDSRLWAAFGVPSEIQAEATVLVLLVIVLLIVLVTGRVPAASRGPGNGVFARREETPVLYWALTSILIAGVLVAAHGVALQLGWRIALPL